MTKFLLQLAAILSGLACFASWKKIFKHDSFLILHVVLPHALCQCYLTYLGCENYVEGIVLVQFVTGEGDR